MNLETCGRDKKQKRSWKKISLKRKGKKVRKRFVVGLCICIFAIGFLFGTKLWASEYTSDNDVRNAEIVFQELESKGKLTENIIRLVSTTLLGFSIVVAGGLLAAGRLSWGAAIAIIAGGMVMGAAAHIARFLTGFGG